MALHEYRIASEEGAGLVSQRLGETKEIGDTVKVDLSLDETRAVVAASWLEPTEEPAAEKSKNK